MPPVESRNHERDWPGTVDQRAALANNVDSGGECGVIYDKRLGLGMPIMKRASAGLTLPDDLSQNHDHDTQLHADCFAVKTASVPALSQSLPVN